MTADSKADRPPPEAEDASQLRVFVRALLTYGVGVALGQAVGLFLLPVYTHWFEPQDFGVFEVLDRLREMLSFSVSSALGLTMIALWQFHRDAAERLEVVRAGVLVQVVCSTVLLGAALATSGAASHWLFADSEHGLLILAIALVTVFELWLIVPLAFWQVQLKATAFVVVSTLMPVTRALLIFVALIPLNLGLPGVLWVWALNCAVYAVILTALLARAGVFARWTVPRPVLAEVLRYGSPFVPNSLMAFLLSSGDRFFLLHYSTAEQVGLYGFGYRVATLLNIALLAPFARVWGSVTIDLAQTDDGMRRLRRIGRGFLAVYLFSASAFVLFHRDVVALLAPARYSGSSVIIPLVIAASFFFASTSVLDASIYITKRTQLKPLITGVSSVVCVLLCFLLIPRQGAIGAAIATVAGYLTMSVLTAILGQRVLPIHWGLGRVLALTVLATVGLIACWRLVEADGPLAWALRLAWLAGFAAVLFALRAVRLGDFRLLLAAARPQGAAGPEETA